jgi:hypothetical protein
VYASPTRKGHSVISLWIDRKGDLVEPASFSSWLRCQLLAQHLPRRSFLVLYLPPFPLSTMAANDYYNHSSSNHNTNNHYTDSAPPTPPPAATKPPTSLYTNYQPSRTSYSNSPYSSNAPLDSLYDDPHHSRDSYYSGVAGGNLHDDRQYADNIPLKSSSSKPYSQDDLTARHSQYPPSPESQNPPKSGLRGRKKQGWFTGRITWVVYITTLVQIGVFIGEIVRNGELDIVYLCAWLICPSKLPKQVHQS